MSNVRSRSDILFLLQPPDRFCSWLLESPSDLCCILVRCSHAINKPINTNRADGVRDQILIQDNHSPGAFMGACVCACVCVCAYVCMCVCACVRVYVETHPINGFPIDSNT